MVGSPIGYGINTSGAREIAKAEASGSTEQLDTAINSLRYASLLGGGLGWTLTLLFSSYLSKSAFGSDSQANTIALLGICGLIACVTGGESAILQGTRKIRELATANIIIAGLCTVTVSIIYATWGTKGIESALISSAIISLVCYAIFSYKLFAVRLGIGITEFVTQSGHLFTMGLAFIYSALLAGAVSFFIRSIIANKLGVDSVGMYQAATALSGLLTNFMLSAISIDFYPQLVGVSSDNDKLNELVNQQIETSSLFSLPGLLLTVLFSYPIMSFFYTSHFVDSAYLMPLFCLGFFGQILIFPLGFIPRAKASVAWIYIGQTEANLVHLLLAKIFLDYFGLVGIAYAFVMHIVIHSALVYFAAYQLSNFSLSGRAKAVILGSSLCMAVSVFIHFEDTLNRSHFSRIIVWVVFSAWVLREIINRVGYRWLFDFYAEKLERLRSLMTPRE
jgi:PST family polysaccharide transporter